MATVRVRNGALMPHDAAVITEIRNRLNVEQIVTQVLGIPLVGRGPERKAFCVFHPNRESPAMSVNLTRGLFHCHNPACGAEGDIYDLYMRRRNVSFPVAVDELARLAGVVTTSGNGSRPPRPPPTPSVEAALLARYQPPDTTTNGTTPEDRSIDPDIPRAFHDTLMHDTIRLAYLHDARRLTDATLRTHLIGHNGTHYTVPVFGPTGAIHNIRQYRPHGQPKMKSWRPGFGRARLYPYAGSAIDGDVLLVEGEWDCLLARQMGLNAWTTTGGSGNWPLADLTALCTGKVVVLALDDDEAGRMAAQKVARALQPHVAGILQLDWTQWAPARRDGAPAGYDFTNAVHDGLTVDDVSALTVDFHIIDEPAPSPPSPPPLAEPTYDDNDDTRLPAPILLRDVVSVPLSFTVEGFTLANDLNLLVGEGGEGKSTVLYHLATAIATGNAAFDARPVAPGPVLILSGGEDDAGLVRNRIAAFARGHRWNITDAEAYVALYDGGLDMDDPAWQGRVIEAIRDLHVVAWFADPLADIIGDEVEENSNTDARRITRAFRRIITMTGAGGTVVHHASKPSEGVQKRHRVRGASAWLNAVRLAWWIEAQEGGMLLTPVKNNRLANKVPIRLKRTIAAEHDGLMWRAARLTVDAAGDVTSSDAVLVLQVVSESASPPNSRELRALLKAQNIGNDRADVAAATAKFHGWITSTDGPNRSKLWTMTDTGRTRLALARTLASSTTDTTTDE